MVRPGLAPPYAGACPLHPAPAGGHAAPRALAAANAGFQLQWNRGKSVWEEATGEKTLCWILEYIATDSNPHISSVARDDARTVRALHQHALSMRQGHRAQGTKLGTMRVGQKSGGAHMKTAQHGLKHSTLASKRSTVYRSFPPSPRARGLTNVSRLSRALSSLVSDLSPYVSPEIPLLIVDCVGLHVSWRAWRMQCAAAAKRRGHAPT
jgi:hypothetical protein